MQALPSRVLKLPHDYPYSDAQPHDFIQPATMLGKPTTGDLKAFAAWMTSLENPRFTQVIANRLRKRVFGLGLIEPVDELFDTTVAVNPALMTRLEKLMVELRYDLKAFLRVLYHTRTYQHEATRQELLAGEVYHFTGPLLRRLTAEQIYDSFVTLIHARPAPPPRRKGIDAKMAQKLVYRGKLSDALDLNDIAGDFRRLDEGLRGLRIRLRPC